jgi:FkbM family methyltransferase
VTARPYEVWGRSLLAPRTRLLPGLGHRLGRRPRVAAKILVGLRRVPGRRLRAALYRNVSRPLAVRMDAQLVVPVSGGSRMIVETSDMMGRVLATSGIWEPHVSAVLPRLLASGDVFVDVGAHAGYYALYASRLVGPHGRVYAVEPAASAHAILRANLALNSATNVVPVFVAAGASEARAQLVEPPEGNTGGMSVRPLSPAGAREPAHSAGEVVVKPVTAILEEGHRARLSLVKIDVEGFEAEVLRGVEPLFAEGYRPALIVEVHPNGVTSATPVLERLLAQFGLRIYELVRDPGRNRFADVPRPREIEELAEVTERCTTRTTNVLLVSPGRAAHLAAAWGSP